MSEHPFRRLIELISFDQNIRTQQEIINDTMSAIEQINQDIAQHDQTLDDAKRVVIKARKIVDEMELDLKELDQQEKDKKKRLDNISNYKEYQSLQTEIAYLQTTQVEQEPALIDAWNKLETTQRQLATIQKEYDEKAAQLQKSLDEKKQKMIAVQAELDAQTKERGQKETGIPDEWLEKYNIMRARVLDPVVAIEGDACGSCFQIIPTQDVLTLNRGALLQCKGCYRFLYAKEAMERNMQKAEDDS